MFAADYAPEEIAEKPRKTAGLPDEPLGEVANPGNGGLVGNVAEKLTWRRLLLTGLGSECRAP